MGTISSGIGLISGLNTADIIDQLMALQRRPVTLLENRISGFTAQQTGLLSISAYLAMIEGSAERLADEDAFNIREATSSNTDVLSVTASAGAPVGSYAFTVSRLVQSHQAISNAFADTDTTPVGAGTITIEMGRGFVVSDTSIGFLNGQAGIDRGSIRITDRSGASTVIDLTDAVTVTDVLDRINTSSDVDVTAAVSGDALVITDNTGQTTSNLIVANVGADTTATDLGIAASVAASRITGSDIIRLTEDTTLRLLNDENGVRDEFGFDDFRITQRDGSTIDVNISGALNLDDILDAINTDDDNTGDLVAQLAADGLRIELVDSSTGGSDLSVTALNDSLAASDLGLLKTVTGGGATLSGDRLVAGVNSVLLRSLAGGSGVDAGSIRVVDRAGTESIIDLADAQTVQDVVDLINDAAVSANVTASVNAAGNGLRITDNTGSSTSPLIVTNSGGSNTATDLGIDTTATGVSASVVEGTDLDLRYISEATLLADLNGGQGVFSGKFTLTDSTGKVATVDLTQDDDTTIADVLLEINSRAVDVVATINATGDGILLTDTGGGAGLLTVAEVDNGSTAADLRILGSAAEGETTIDGSFEVEIEIGEDDSLQDLVNAITDAGIPVSASIINDGSPGASYRLSLVSAYSGRLGRLLVDTGETGLSMNTLVEGRDATLRFGSAAAGGEPLVITSHTNTITGVLDGVTIDLVSTSASPVTVSVVSDTDGIVSTVSQWVDAINAALDGIDELTNYDIETETAGVLQGEITVTRVQNKLYNLVMDTYSGVGGSYTSLREIGVRIGEGARITLDEDQLRQALGNGLVHVRDLFAAEDVGVGDTFYDTLYAYTGDNPGLIDHRVESLDDRIDLLTKQKDQYEVRLAAERKRLELQFAQLEEALAGIQRQQTMLGFLQYIGPTAGSNEGSSLF